MRGGKESIKGWNDFFHPKSTLGYTFTKHSGPGRLSYPLLVWSTT